jgi:hypothetical protein
MWQCSAQYNLAGYGLDPTVLQQYAPFIFMSVKVHSTPTQKTIILKCIVLYFTIVRHCTQSFISLSTTLIFKIHSYKNRSKCLRRCTLHLKILTRSSDIVNLNAKAEWWDSNTHKSLYSMASSWLELQRKALQQKLIHIYHKCYKNCS